MGPQVLLQNSSFWVFGKSVNWVCSNASPNGLKEFAPGVVGGGGGSGDGPNSKKRKKYQEDDKDVKHVHGSLPAYVVARFGKEHPFVCENTEMFHPATLRSFGVPKAGYGMLHRLDRETSGPVLFAKNKAAFGRLVKERDAHNWHKEYVTLVHGKVPPHLWRGVIDTPLSRRKQGNTSAAFHVRPCSQCKDRTNLNENHKCPRPDNDQYECLGVAKSFYEVVKWYKYRNQDGEDMDYTFIRVKLVSGKTHQIRVHMRHFGEQHGLKPFGVCSDFKYTKDNFPKEYREDLSQLCSRVFLHSVVLGFRDPDDPFTNQIAKFDLEKDLVAAIDKMDSNDEAYGEMLRARNKEKETEIGRFVVDFMLNSDVENKLNKCWESEKLMKRFRYRCPNPVDKPALRSFNGDHSAMVKIVVDQLNEELDDVDVLVDRQFPECNTEDNNRLKLPKGWVKKESRSNPGAFYYRNDELNKVQIEHPGRSLLDGLPPGWRKIESRTKPGNFYYYDSITSKSYLELPDEIKEQMRSVVANPKSTGSSGDEDETNGRILEEAQQLWEKRNSTTHRGLVYWFNRKSRAVSKTHPFGLEVLPPGWTRVESQTIRGKYFFQETMSKKIQQEHPVTKKKWHECPDPWQFMVSKTDSSVCYWKNTLTDQVTQTHPVTGVSTI